MRACVFSKSLSVLVNGFPIKQVHKNKGSKQGDIGDWSFGEKGGWFTHYFKGFRLPNCDEVVSHFEYVDDTLFIGETCAENL